MDFPHDDATETLRGLRLPGHADLRRRAPLSRAPLLPDLFGQQTTHSGKDVFHAPQVAAKSSLESLSTAYTVSTVVSGLASIAGTDATYATSALFQDPAHYGEEPTRTVASPKPSSPLRTASLCGDFEEIKPPGRRRAHSGPPNPSSFEAWNPSGGSSSLSSSWGPSSADFGLDALLTYGEPSDLHAESALAPFPGVQLARESSLEWSSGYSGDEDNIAASGEDEAPTGHSRVLNWMDQEGFVSDSGPVASQDAFDSLSDGSYPDCAAVEDICDLLLRTSFGTELSELHQPSDVFLAVQTCVRELSEIIKVDGKHRAAPTGSSASANAWSGPSRQGSSRKRSSRRDDDDDDELIDEGDGRGQDGDDGDGREGDGWSSKRSGPSKRSKKPPIEDCYACPFRKRNPLRFNVRDHSNCALGAFSDMANLKRHIKGFHRSKPAPSILCLRCGEAMPTQTALTEHLMVPSEDMCSPRAKPTLTTRADPEDGIDDVADNVLTARRLNNKVYTWEGLWRVVFPEDSVADIPNPDFVPVVELDEVANRFLQEFEKGELRSRLQRPITLTSTGAEVIAKAFVEDVLTSCGGRPALLSRPKSRRTVGRESPGKEEGGRPPQAPTPPPVLSPLSVVFPQPHHVYPDWAPFASNIFRGPSTTAGSTVSSIRHLLDPVDDASTSGTAPGARDRDAPPRQTDSGSPTPRPVWEQPSWGKG